MTGFLTRTIFVYGAIAGALTIAMTILWSRSEASAGALGLPIGYLIMLVDLSLIFVGIKQYRDVEGGGVIKFGRAALVGLAMAGVAALIYMFVWEGYMMATDYSFYDAYLEAAAAELATQGLEETARAAKEAELSQFKSLFRSRVFRLFVSFTEIFPVGFVVSLVSAGLLRNPNFMPARRS
ncbi:MAG: DUF4199 domain-containing protein [Pseudomonadota bacterium]